MRTILVPVDGSACAERAIEEAVKLTQKSGAMDIHLLNVQPRIFVEETLVYLDAAKMDTYYYGQGSKGLASAEKLLKKAGIAYTAHRAVGPVAETIVTKAKETGGGWNTDGNPRTWTRGRHAARLRVQQGAAPLSGTGDLRPG